MICGKGVYFALAKNHESEMAMTEGYKLSSALQDPKRLFVATAMSCYYSKGKPGLFFFFFFCLSKVMDGF